MELVMRNKITPVTPAATARRRRTIGLMLMLCIGVASGIDSRGGAIAGETNGPFIKDPPAAAADGIDPVTKFLLDDALAQGRVTKQRYAALMRDYEEQAYLRQPAFKFWYDRGFNLGTTDNAFLLRIRGRLDAQFVQRARNEAWRDPGDGKNFPDLVGVFGDYRVNRSEKDASTMSLRRARLYFMGHVFDPDMKFFVQIRMDSAGDSSQTQSAVQLYDYYILNTKLDWANAQIGQYKVYFNRAQINSTASMQFAERALVQDAFTASGLDRRDIGLTIMNDEERHPVNYYLGVFGGAGPNFTRLGNFDSEQIQQGCPGGQQTVPFPPGAVTCSDITNTTLQVSPLQRNLNADTRRSLDRLMFSARLNWNVLGRPGYGEGDMAYSKSPQFAIGGGYAYNPRVNTSTNNAFIGVDLANLNVRRQIAAGGNGRQLGWGVVDYATWAVDSVFKYRGFSLQGEFYYKNVIRREKGPPCVEYSQQLGVGGFIAGTPFTCTRQAPGELGNAYGWYAQSGYYLIPRYLELAARYSYWDPDTNAAADLIKQADVSLNWFINGTYDHAVQITYSNVAMGTGGFAIGRSNPLPVINSSQATFPNASIPVDAVGGTLVENAIRIQYRLFF
ncbi:porin [Nitrospira lenta]|uniref:Putative Anion-selective porin n=1 Tax=Nitrospira lenta TaxID=1436998 RepID=A0A330KZM0_9BACT|nr:porin [Nitrospira lenta]SPP62971.1 putative Anion-selective porin [Nitrospira lenta]